MKRFGLALAAAALLAGCASAPDTQIARSREMSDGHATDSRLRRKNVPNDVAVVGKREIEQMQNNGPGTSEVPVEQPDKY